MNFHVQQVIKGLSLQDFETLFFDETFNIALCKSLKLNRELVKRDVKDGKLSRVVRVGPQREIPAPVAKVLGAEKIEYTEYLDYVMGSNHGTWHTASSLLSDKIKSAGSFSFKEQADGILRVVEGDVTVKIFGLGKVVEKFIIADIERGYVHAAKFTEDWVAGVKS